MNAAIKCIQKNTKRKKDNYINIILKSGVLYISDVEQLSFKRYKT